MADGSMEPVFTVKEMLSRIDSKQDKLEEKIDRVAEGLDRKADVQQFRDLQDRVTITEQQQGARLQAYERLEARVDKYATAIEDKAEKADVGALYRVLVGALSGSAIAILAWALTVFVR